jgi:hypothetical protein
MKKLLTFLFLIVISKICFAETIDLVCNPMVRNDGVKYEESFVIKLTKDYMIFDGRKYNAGNRENNPPYTNTTNQIYFGVRPVDVFIVSATFKNEGWFPNDIDKIKSLFIKKIEGMSTFFNNYEMNSYCKRF